MGPESVQELLEKFDEYVKIKPWQNKIHKILYLHLRKVRVYEPRYELVDEEYIWTVNMLGSIYLSFIKFDRLANDACVQHL